ncbi:MAG TPA: hypothetical protein GXX49_00385 [Clostridiaceae bacterium]|nr:hypothetical protein [Clostridiaceae bacterium]
MDEPKELRISSFGGKVEAYSWSKNEVWIEVTGTVNSSEKELKEELLSNIRINEEESSKNLCIDIAYYGSPKYGKKCSANVVLYLPREWRHFSIKLDRGELNLIDDFRGVMNAELGTVDVNIRSFFGLLDIRNDRGNVCISNGKLKTGSRICCNTGNVSIKSDLEERGNYEIGTGFGDIRLLFPYGKFLEINSIGNMIKNEFALADNVATSHNHSSSGNPVQVNIRSSAGSISIEKYAKR